MDPAPGLFAGGSIVSASGSAPTATTLGLSGIDKRCETRLASILCDPGDLMRQRAENRRRSKDFEVHGEPLGRQSFQPRLGEPRVKNA